MSSTLSLSGLASNLDTSGIINSLVKVQQNQQTLLKTRQTSAQTRADAYASLSSSLSSLGKLTAELAKTSGWAGSTATSTSTAVTATATGTATGSLTFDVTAVAAAHTLISSSTVASTNSTAASGALTLTKNDGTTQTIEVGNGSLAAVVSAINSAGAGLTATAVNTGGGYKLQVASTSTGASSSFTLDGLDGLGGTAVLTSGTDASVTVGTNPETAYSVNSSTNKFSGLVSGLDFTVSKLESGVTVAATLDGSAVADKISAVVDAANSILTTIASKSKYDTAKKTGGPFVGESTVRSLQQNLLTTVSSLGAPGVSVTRDGALSFDRSAFLTAFVKDPNAVAKAFGVGSNFTAAPDATTTTATVTSALKTARAGNYALTVTSAPANEAWQVDTSGTITGQTISLTRGTTSVSYTATDTDTLDTAAAAFNSTSAAAKFGVTATVDGNSLVFTADSAGTSGAFTAALDGTDGTQLTAGVDIAGTIDGQTATGSGSTLSLPVGTGGAVGLSIVISTTSDEVAATGGAIGSISYKPGLAQQLTTLISQATSSSGSVTTAKAGSDASVKRYQNEIDDWDARLTTYREMLTRQFTAMETAIQKLNTSMSAVSQLTAKSSSSSSDG